MDIRGNFGVIEPTGRVMRCWNGLPRKVFGSSSLEMFEVALSAMAVLGHRLDSVMDFSSLIGCAVLWAEVAP